MSNTTLDAAKTSRVIQLLQTSADLLDLNHLAKGLLLVDSDAVLLLLTLFLPYMFALFLSIICDRVVLLSGLSL